MMKKWIGFCWVLLAFNQCIAQENTAGATVNWGYKGNQDPARWAVLDPAFAECAKGKQQSPINIKTQKLSAAENTLLINYTPSQGSLGIDLTTDLSVGNQHLEIKDGHGVQVNNHSPKETVTFNNEVYRLVQFHFHTPSENAINNVSYPAEIHFVHQSEHGNVLVLAVFVAGGQTNQGIENITNQLKAGMNPTPLNFVPADLLPPTRSYYHFMGSLTTPPCTEGLQWVVFKTPISATPAEIVWLRKANGGANARPIQATNNRVVSLNQ